MTQINTILGKISCANICLFDNFISYYECLKCIDKNKYEKNNKHENTTNLKIIPILIMSGKISPVYSNYHDYLFKNIKRIQTKLSTSLKNNMMPILCPLEYVIL